MTSRPDQEQSILERARRFDSEATRSEYLIEICGDDSEMLERIQNQLRSKSKKPADGEDPTFVQTPPVSLIETDEFLESSQNRADRADDSYSSNQAGKTIAGRYELLQPIAEGGMGSVWLAQQSEPVKRQVAIKLIKAGMDSRQVLARFEAERQALAVMDHPNIAKVFDGGLTEQDRPYFAMEYVQGVPLTKYCDQHKLSIPERLKLFITICRAVQHAHQKGVIHRDLKPSNVLVGTYDDQPMSKVIDFGLAKAMDQSLTEQSLNTAHGVVLGTPLYMSPEQTNVGSLDIDTRTDIYSLGVILYELLTGSTPLEREQLKQASLEEKVRLIREVEPPLPSTRVSSSDQQASIADQRGIDPGQLKRNIVGDLDWVVMKALEKDRDRRYETANGLAADIQRHLNDEPVTAGPPSARYRMQKFVRRNRLAVVASSFVAMALLIGIAGTTYGLFKASNALIAKDIALNEKDVALHEKDQALKETRKTIDNYVETVQNAELLKEERFKPLLKELLKDAVDHYQRFIKEHEHDEASLDDLAEAVANVAYISRTSGDVQKAIQAWRQEMEIFKQLVESHPTVDKYQYNLARCLNDIALVLYRTGPSGESRESYVQAMEILNRLTQAHPEVANYQVGLTTTLIGMGKLSQSNGQLDEALEQYQQALAIQQRLHNDSSDKTDRWRTASAVAETQNWIGDLYRSTGKLDEAIDLYEQALEIQTRLTNEHPSKPSFQESRGATLANLGIVYHWAGQSGQAIEWYQRSRDTFRTLVKEHPNFTPHQARLSASIYNLGLLYKEIDELDDAIETLTDALTIRKRLIREQPSDIRYLADLANNYNTLGDAYRKNGNDADAIQAIKEGIAIFEQLVTANPQRLEFAVSLAGSYINVAIIHWSTKETETAEESFEKGIKLLSEIARENSDLLTVRQFLRNAYIARAKFMNSQKRFEEEFADNESALVCIKQLANRNPANTRHLEDQIDILTRMGIFHDTKGQKTKAVETFQQAAEIQKQMLSSNSAESRHSLTLARIYNCMGRSLETTGNLQDAFAHFQLEKAVLEDLFGRDSKNFELAVNLSASCVNTGNMARRMETPEYGQAKRMFTEAIEILTSVPESSSPDAQAKTFLRNAYWGRALVMDELKEFEKAADDWAKAIKHDSGEKTDAFQKKLDAAKANSRDN